MTFEEVFSEAERAILHEALHALRRIKVEAMETLNATGMYPAGALFRPRDFGIPAIDALLERLDEEEDEDEKV